MNYKVLYSKKKDFNNPSLTKYLKNIGNWRSRWQRKRELDKAKGFEIKRINTKPTDKDYIFINAYGYDRNMNSPFKIVPTTSAPRRRRRKYGNMIICKTKGSKYNKKVCPVTVRKRPKGSIRRKLKVKHGVFRKVKQTP